MYKCVKVVVHGVRESLAFMRTEAEVAAREQLVEGVLRMRAPDCAKLVVAGSKEHVDAFIDFLYTVTAEHTEINIEIEPTFKERDYRGVFRVIQ